MLLLISHIPNNRRLPWSVTIQDLVLLARLTIDTLEIVHLRDGPMLSLVVPCIRKGGVNCVYVVRQLVLAVLPS